jgi:hypothetical protein
VAIAGDTDVHYDPDDVDITADPQPANAQLRHAAPISYKRASVPSVARHCPVKAAPVKAARLKLPG